MTAPTPEFLDSIADRLVQYGEPASAACVLRLRLEAETGRILRDELGSNEHLYGLVKVEDTQHFDGTYTYQLRRREENNLGLPALLYLSDQEAADLDKQLEAAGFVLDTLVAS